MPQWLTFHAPAMTFDSKENDKIALIGPSGIGKSRLLKSLCGLDEAELWKKAKSDSTIAFTEASGTIAYIHQRAHFIPGTVEENLKWPFQFKQQLGKQYQRAQIVHWLRQLGLSEDILNKTATNLSGGEGQILHLLRSLQLHPKTIFLDEPTASLDPRRTALVEHFLNEWCSENRAQMIFISHNEEQTKRWATRIVSMNENGLFHA